MQKRKSEAGAAEDVKLDLTAPLCARCQGWGW